MKAYIGAATSGGKGSPASGITAVDIDGAAFDTVGGADIANPMYLALSPGGDVLYSLTEREQGSVSAFTTTGAQLAPLGKAHVTGAEPCHLSVHPSERLLLIANYQTGSIVVHPINDDGSVGAACDTVTHHGSGPNQQRQQAAHAHMVVVDPATGDGRGHILATDLGTDTVYRYTLDAATGQLRPFDELHTPPGAGPRHLVVEGKYAYVANELDSTVTVFDLDSGSPVTHVSTRPVGSAELSNPSAIRLSPDGRFLYVANRFVDEIAVLSVDGPNLTLVDAIPCGGEHPRDIVLSPDGRYLYSANQFADTITTFRVDMQTGALTPEGEPFQTPSPACVVWA
jgi:6-phosphogluconolactonase (cycloisomerase 2 family)